MGDVVFLQHPSIAPSPAAEPIAALHRLPRVGKRQDIASVKALMEQLDWIADFCDRCAEAFRLDNLDEMTRVRDDLAQALRDRQAAEA